MKTFVDLLAALGQIAWPALIGALVWTMRSKLATLADACVSRIKQSHDIEIGVIKLRGPIVVQQDNVIKSIGSGVKLVSADSEDLARRHKRHADTRCMMLVHTIRPSEPEKYVEGLRVFDVSVYLHTHRQNGKFNDVNKVEYYFGDKWGKDKFGSKFIVDTSNDQFALTARMYGSCLCIAEIFFHDGKSEVVERYLDVECAPLYGVKLSQARQ